jgi:hypothetical protein
MKNVIIDEVIVYIKMILSKIEKKHENFINAPWYIRLIRVIKNIMNNQYISELQRQVEKARNNKETLFIMDIEKAKLLIDYAQKACNEIQMQMQDDILRDAKRYRWLRDSDNFPIDDIPDDSIWDHLCEKDRADFDSFIDLMMGNESLGAAKLLMLSADQSEVEQS